MDNKMTAEQAIQDFEEYVAASGGSDVWAMNRAHAIRQALSAPRVGRATLSVQDVSSLEDYDSGLLNDYGGGNVGWWQDYIRHEVDAANQYWREQVESMLAASPEPVASLCEAHGKFPCRDCGTKHYDGCKCGFCVTTSHEPVAQTVDHDRIKELEGYNLSLATESHEQQQLIADLRAEVEALRKDADRLDWLDKNVTRVSDSERCLSRSVYWGGGTNKDVREAIDAARLREGGE